MNDSVAVYNLSKDESEEYPLGAAVPSDILEYSRGGDVRLQISKDNKSLFVTSLVNDTPSNDYYAVFSVVDFRNGNTTAKYEYTPSDDYYLDETAWISTDGKYGYVVQNYCGDDYDSHSSYDVVTIDLNSKKTVNSSEFDKSGYRVVVNDNGAAIGTSCYVSKEGDATCTYYSNLEYSSINQDGSLVLGLYNGDCHGLGSSSSELESLEMIVVDNKTGETQWRAKYPNEISLYYRDDFGALSDNGRFALVNGRDDNDNNLLYLIDTKTGAHSQLNLRGSLEYDRVGEDDYWGSAWFSKDCSLIMPFKIIRMTVLESMSTRAVSPSNPFRLIRKRKTAHPPSIPFSSSLLLRFSSRRAWAASLSFACANTLRHMRRLRITPHIQRLSRRCRRISSDSRLRPSRSRLLRPRMHRGSAVRVEARLRPILNSARIVAHR